MEGHEAGEGPGGVVCGIAGALAVGGGGFGGGVAGFGGGFGGFGDGERVGEGGGREVGGCFVLGFVAFVFVRHGGGGELVVCCTCECFMVGDS